MFAYDAHRTDAGRVVRTVTAEEARIVCPGLRVVPQVVKSRSPIAKELSQEGVLSPLA